MPRILIISPPTTLPLYVRLRYFFEHTYNIIFHRWAVVIKKEFDVDITFFYDVGSEAVKVLVECLVASNATPRKKKK